MNVLYFDCFAGIAGDMTVAALLELGLPLDHLRRELARLPLPGSTYDLSVETVSRKGIAGCHFSVKVAQDQPHRHYGDIVAMIDGSSLTRTTKDKAQRIFRRLAEAEAKVHGMELDRVHFHEVGAVDSIIDVVGAAIGLDYLGVGEIYASSLPLGSGYIETAHGRLPVPAPATAELLRGLPAHGNSGPGERVTPTGAAIVAALATAWGAPPAMEIKKIGYGAGSKDFADMPNLLRLVLGETTGTMQRDEIVVLETNIDDMNPELLGFLMERLFAEGALDVSFAPLQMKKNRPGTQVTVIAPCHKRDELARLILAESTAIGVRYYPAQRLVLSRTTEERPTSLGPVKVKVVEGHDRIRRVVPEFEECRRLAVERGLPLMDVYRLVEREAAEK
ncbi:nickel pincer cofactor biosynthesis protein LarC [Geotalea sp. SG265]|uniref:nickel pincer cofactor biosynthesis protein LarC n=1 Tax=Geotalea sp. SG265 TaxID=2922867 RepID=UPI001FAF9F6A|nr:nickel pincer cofactor biosynthesis protein LarC [Geotalea sp. SG265]